MEHGAIPLHHLVELEDSSSSSNWDHDDEVDLIWQLCLEWLPNRQVINILYDYMFVLHNRWDRLLLIHFGEADVSDTEDILVYIWICRLVLFDERVPISHLTHIIDQNLATSLINALSQLSLQVHVRTKEFHARAIDHNIPIILEILVIWCIVIDLYAKFGQHLFCSVVTAGQVG